MTQITETDRLIIREFTINDYKDLYRFGSIPKVQKYTEDKVLKNHLEAKKIISNIIQNQYLINGYGRWAVIFKNNKHLIGAAGLKYLSEINETDIGYRFLPSYWNKGIASEAVKAITEYGFKKIGLQKINGFVIPENIASSIVLQKNGYRFDKQQIYPTDKKVYNWYFIFNK
ncbi:MAG: GNAT family N-acetyltransferase [Crocinitomicaceae bacterium]|nr:GNAT family N-acetyltransferase [Crocinitomicaceae bacterium]